MTSFRLLAPYIRWGTNLSSALYIPFPLDNVASYSDPRDGSETIAGPSGARDAWTVATDYFLEGDIRWIPATDTLFYPRSSGWDSTFFAGYRAFFEYARDMNTFSWHPDGRNLLRLPQLNNAGAVTLGGLGGWAITTDAGLTGTTNAFDAVEGAWQLSATNPTGVTKGVFIYQNVPTIAGEAVCLTADFRALSLAGGALGVIQVDMLDAGALYLSTTNFASSAAGVYTRITTGMGTIAPSGAAYARVYAYLNLPAGASGSVRFKNMMLRRDSTDATFVGNGSFDGCYLVEPMKGPPAPEDDGSRKTRIKIVATSDFNFY